MKKISNAAESLSEKTIGKRTEMIEQAAAIAGFGDKSSFTSGNQKEGAKQATSESYEQLKKLMASEEYKQHRAIAHNLCNYGQVSQHTVLKPNEAYSPDHYVSAGKRIELWEDGIKSFSEKTLLRYQTLLLGFNQNNPIEADLYNEFRDDFMDNAVTAVSTRYQKNIDNIINDPKDFSIPHYLNRYVEEHYDRIAKQENPKYLERNLVQSYADMTHPKFDDRVRLELGISLAIRAYSEHGGSSANVDVWWKRFDTARHDIRALADKKSDVIATNLVFPVDMMEGAQGDQIREEAAHTFKLIYGRNPSHIFLQSSIVSAPRKRMLSLTEGLEYTMVPLYVVTENRDTLTVQYGAFEKNVTNGESFVSLVYSQDVPKQS